MAPVCVLIYYHNASLRTVSKKNHHRKDGCMILTRVAGESTLTGQQYPPNWRKITTCRELSTMNTAIDGPEPTTRFRSRSLQRALAVPSLLLWALLSGLALVWSAGVVIGALSGRLVATGDWRFPYLIIVVSLVLVCAGLTARTLWRAYQGQSLLWWHGATFGVGLVFIVLLGIAGD